MGNVKEDVMKRWNNQPRRVTVRSFYMDETEVRNVDYREYLYWLKRVFADMPEVHDRALPDTLVWRRPLAYNEPMVENYLRHPAYSEYPVVGVSWVQEKTKVFLNGQQIGIIDKNIDNEKFFIPKNLVKFGQTNILTIKSGYTFKNDPISQLLGSEEINDYDDIEFANLILKFE